MPVPNHAPPKNILITGQPGIGKTTLIIRLADALKHLSPAGFYTREVCEKNIRKGFDLIGLTGEKGRLSHVDFKSPYQIGKYWVDVAGFERFLDRISLKPAALIFIDEIGKMECLSAKFNKMLRKLFDADVPIIATISLKGIGLISELKTRPDVVLFEMTQSNRDGMVKDILSIVEPLIA